MADELLTRLCKCLAFHVVETERSFLFMTPKDQDVAARIEEAKVIVAEAGFDIDILCQAAERPTAVDAAYVDGALGAAC
ncbi:hypothetical protein HFN89_00305 [Rhizobium laguerreae]|nr:hypothetical protein [Rhizobium laguerreae]